MGGYIQRVPRQNHHRKILLNEFFVVRAGFADEGGRPAMEVANSAYIVCESRGD